MNNKIYTNVKYPNSLFFLRNPQLKQKIGYDHENSHHSVFLNFPLFLNKLNNHTISLSNDFNKSKQPLDDYFTEFNDNLFFNFSNVDILKQLTNSSNTSTNNTISLLFFKNNQPTPSLTTYIKTPTTFVTLNSTTKLNTDLNHTLLTHFIDLKINKKVNKK